MKIAVIGLGKMGQQIVSKLVAGGQTVIALDSDPAQVQKVAVNGVLGAASREDVATKFSGDLPIIWLMIPQNIVDSEIVEWKKLLPVGSTIIDGGNSLYTDTTRRHELLRGGKIEYIDVGTSGGVLGAENGFSMMIGGNENAVSNLDLIFKCLASPYGSYKYFGPSGSGHFVKMVHNAIEYGYMESLAEGYQLLASGPYKGLDLAAVAEVWQHGSIIEFKLNEVAGTILQENPKLDGVEGIVETTGEANWAVNEAAKLNQQMPAISAALEVRVKSQSGSTSFATKLFSNTQK